LSHIRKYLPTMLGIKASNLSAESNHYYDVSTCGIGYHGDSERKIVIGIRLGKDFPLCFYWHLGKDRISQQIDLELHSGDMYVMDKKACGFDWKRKLIPTLRHAAGCDKYIL
jgi:alkylated DNA repair dioxygenase AlkB